MWTAEITQNEEILLNHLRAKQQPKQFNQFDTILDYVFHMITEICAKGFSLLKRNYCKLKTEKKMALRLLNLSRCSLISNIIAVTQNEHAISRFRRINISMIGGQFVLQ